MKINNLDELLDLLLELTDEHCNGTENNCRGCALRDSEECLVAVIEAARSLEWEER